MAQFRYLVDDVDASIAFYVDKLGFALEQQYGPAMAILNRGNMTLWLAGPMASASQPMPDGSKPTPGGWNRFVLVVDDIKVLVTDLRAAGVEFKNEITEGPGGLQCLCADPSGNVIELFQAA